VRKISYSLSLSVASISLLFFCSVVCVGQNREKFVISAKAGGINAVTGQASVHAKGQFDWQQLMVTDDLDAGDRVKTASDGRVEILLNPGSYLRVGGNSEIELSNNSLANLEVRLLRGTAIVEATGAEGLELNINISTPHTKLAIVRGGLYRLNVVPGDATELIVRKGRVILNDSQTKVKGGNKVVFSATVVSVAKLTKQEEKIREDVDDWSKDRAQVLAMANRRINSRMMNTAFDSFRESQRGFFGFRSFGLWYFNSIAGCYTFLPFSYGFGSPYGSSYSTSIYGGYFGGGYSNGYPNGAYIPPNSGSNPGYNPGSSTQPSSGSYPTRSNPVSMPASSGPRDPDSGSRINPRTTQERTIQPGRP
jgi:hypothetical protein